MIGHICNTWWQWWVDAPGVNGAEKCIPSSYQNSLSNSYEPGDVLKLLQSVTHGILINVVIGCDGKFRLIRDGSYLQLKCPQTGLTKQVKRLKDITDVLHSKTDIVDKKTDVPNGKYWLTDRFHQAVEPGEGMKIPYWDCSSWLSALLIFPNCHEVSFVSVSSSVRGEDFRSKGKSLVPRNFPSPNADSRTWDSKWTLSPGRFFIRWKVFCIGNFGLDLANERKVRFCFRKIGDVTGRQLHTMPTVNSIILNVG